MAKWGRNAGESASFLPVTREFGQPRIRSKRNLLYRRPFASAARISRARRPAKAAATSGPTLMPPVRPLAVGAGQVGRDRLAGEVVDLGAREQRAGAADAARGPPRRSRRRAAPRRRARRRSGRRRAAPRRGRAFRRAARRSPRPPRRRRAGRATRRSAMSAPRHQPASVARSWVATQATDSGG